ncbi:DUF6233 domain-containing protein [Streptomyces sp. NPDC058394]
MWVDRIDEAIAAAEQRERERQQGEERRPPTPDWIVELSIGVGARPIEVHVGGCYAAGKRQRGITRDQALAALADGMQACSHCRPDTELGVLVGGPAAVQSKGHLSHHRYTDRHARPRPVQLGQPDASAVSSGQGAVRAPPDARTYEHSSALRGAFACRRRPHRRDARPRGHCRDLHRSVGMGDLPLDAANGTVAV